VRHSRRRPIAWNQPAITDAAVTFIIIGQLADASTVPDRLAAVVEAGIMPAHLVPEWEMPARGLYDDQPQRQRDEAVRSATFGTAAMIYTARSLGLGSTPMIGFDAEAVHREFGLQATAFLDWDQAPLAREKALAALDLTVMGELRGVDGCPAVLSGTGKPYREAHPHAPESVVPGVP
jgi:nitroreductase